MQFHIHSNNSLAQKQYGFRTNSSTELAAYNLANNTLRGYDNKLLVGGLFCDFTKAFDCVKHDILLTKLEFFGINGKARDVIKSYSNDRYQRIAIKNEYSKNSSNLDKVKQGVPQGSILGPLFFLLYIND